MSLPPSIAETLVRFGVPADTRATISDLHMSLGPGVIEIVAEMCEGDELKPDQLRPEHLADMRVRLGKRYLDRHLGDWQAGTPTPAFWYDRRMGASTTGLAMALGDLEAESTPLASRVAAATRAAAGPNQPPPRGLLVLSRNSHFGNRPEVFSVDLIPAELDAAQRVNAAQGRQHTLPGSVGETSGTLTADPGVALVWEVQPNIYKPSKDRNREAGPAYRKHRHWHASTLAATLLWLLDNRYEVFALRGTALKITHEVNPNEPMTEAVEKMHDRTLRAVVDALALDLLEPATTPAAVRRLANVALGKEMDRVGIGQVVWRVGRRA